MREKGYIFYLVCFKLSFFQINHQKKVSVSPSASLNDTADGLNQLTSTRAFSELPLKISYKCPFENIPVRYNEGERERELVEKLFKGQNCQSF